MIQRLQLPQRQRTTAIAPAADGGGAAQSPAIGPKQQPFTPSPTPLPEQQATLVPAGPPPVPTPPPPPAAPGTPAPAAGAPGAVPLQGGVQPVYASTANTGGYVPSPGAFGGEKIGSEVEKYGSDAMKTPSRFDSELVKQGLGVINKDAEVATGNRMRSLSELMAKRGLVGSSVEGDSARNLLGDIEQTRSRSALDLGLEQARTYASDRDSAGRLGMSAAELQRELGGDRENANRYGYEAGRSQTREEEAKRQFEKQYGLAERGQTSDERNKELEMLLRAYGLMGSGTATA